MKNQLIIFSFLIILSLISQSKSLETQCEIEKCLNCSADSKSCIKCSDNYTYTRNEHRCVYNHTCPRGKYSSKGKCLDCDGSCHLCHGPKQYQCFDCNKGYYPYFYNYFYTKCLTCISPYCETCNDVGNCTKCLPGYHLLPNKTCVDCLVSNCKECSKNQNVCDKCNFGFIKIMEKNKTICINEGKCIIGTYLNKSQNYQCQNCSANCKHCYGPGNNHCYKCSGN